jgi:hypothetical protein
MYGNDNRVEIEDALVIDQFTKCASFPCYAPITSSMFKTLFKNDGSYEKLGVHRPKKRAEKDASKIQWVNGSGHPLGAEYLDKATVTYGPNGGIDLACINHYSVKSAKAFCSKMKRGLPNRSEKKLDLGYWVDRNFNQVEDVSIRRNSENTAAQMNVWLEDRMLGDLHRAGVAWHQECAEAVLQDMEGVRLFTRIVSLSRTELNPRFAASLTQVTVAARRKEKDS